MGRTISRGALVRSVPDDNLFVGNGMNGVFTVENRGNYVLPPGTVTVMLSKNIPDNAEINLFPSAAFGHHDFITINGTNKWSALMKRRSLVLRFDNGPKLEFSSRGLPITFFTFKQHCHEDRCKCGRCYWKHINELDGSPRPAPLNMPNPASPQATPDRWHSPGAQILHNSMRLNTNTMYRYSCKKNNYAVSYSIFYPNSSMEDISLPSLNNIHDLNVGYVYLYNRSKHRLNIRPENGTILLDGHGNVIENTHVSACSIKRFDITRRPHDRHHNSEMVWMAI